MFLEIMEGGRSEFGPLRHRIVLVFGDWLRFFLLLHLQGLLDRLFRFIFGKELVEIHAGVTTVKVGQALGQELIPLDTLMKSLGVFFLKEDVKTFLVVHLN